MVMVWYTTILRNTFHEASSTLVFLDKRTPDAECACCLSEIQPIQPYECLLDEIEKLALMQRGWVDIPSPSPSSCKGKSLHYCYSRYTSETLLRDRNRHSHTLLLLCFFDACVQFALDGRARSGRHASGGGCRGGRDRSCRSCRSRFLGRGGIAFFSDGGLGGRFCFLRLLFGFFVL